MIHIDMHIIWTVVDLLLLLVLLRVFLFKPVLGMIEKRKNIIQTSLSEADEKNAAAGELKKQYENSLKDAKQESFQIVSEAKDRAQVQYNQIIEKANADASQIVKQANAAAEADRGITHHNPIENDRRVGRNGGYLRRRFRRRFSGYLRRCFRRGLCRRFRCRFCCRFRGR
ncbi:MAG: ATP synthase F0 subunit B, partial [Bacilli bacterium]|nr:ATP synthase F0 subunit B [Bacilli bacterium]